MSEHSFEPEVVALLDEIARSSGPNLLRTPKERLLRWVGRPEEVISPHGSYLSKAERHLVTAYREQAAAVLHAACVERLAMRRDSGVFVESWRRPDMREVDSRALQLRSKLSSKRGNGGIQEHPDFPLNHASLGASQLATASLRLVPADQTRITLGDCYHVEGLPVAALRMFEQVLLGRPTCTMRAVAHDNRGGVHCALGDYAEALDCYVDAGRSAGDRWKTAISRMIIELQLGRVDDARQSAKRIASLEVNPDWLDELVRFLEQTRKEGCWELTAKAEKAITGLQGSMPEEARRVCNALHPINA